MLSIEMLSEPVIVHDVYVSGLGEIEDMADGNMRFVFYATRKTVYGEVEHTVEARLVISRQAVWQAVKMTLAQFGINCMGMACPNTLKRMLN